MDFGKHDVKFRSPVLLTLAMLIIIPPSTGYIDCRISCRRCNKNTEHPAVLEVYCAMCKECKQRRRERMLGRSLKVKEKIKMPSVRMRDGIEGSTDNEALIMRPQEALQLQEPLDQDLQSEFLEQQAFQPQEQQEPLKQMQLPQPPLPPPQSHQQQPQKLPQQPRLTNSSPKPLRGIEYQTDCPPLPLCSDSEEEVDHSQKKLMYVDPSEDPTSKTTMPCPPVSSCKKKQTMQDQQVNQHSCQNPCMISAAMPIPMPMCPCYMYPPVLGTYTLGPGMQPVLGTHTPGPGMQPVLGTHSPGPSMQPQATNEQPSNPELVQLTQPMESVQTYPASTTTQDYHYVYIGLPKNNIRELLPLF